MRTSQDIRDEQHTLETLQLGAICELALLHAVHGERYQEQITVGGRHLCVEVGCGRSVIIREISPQQRERKV